MLDCTQTKPNLGRQIYNIFFTFLNKLNHCFTIKKQFLAKVNNYIFFKLKISFKTVFCYRISTKRVIALQNYKIFQNFVN